MGGHPASVGRPPLQIPCVATGDTSLAPRYDTTQHPTRTPWRESYRTSSASAASAAQSAGRMPLLGTPAYGLTSLPSLCRTAVVVSAGAWQANLRTA